MSSFSEIEARIIKLRDGGSRFSTERMQNFANALGEPQKNLNIIHLAGTNGKGSTSAILEAILREHNQTTGLFTSPHLIRINERIQCNRQNISDEDFVRIFYILEKAAKKIEAEDKTLAPTFFEYITALGFVYFKEKHCDWTVLETGLGGRLDASNIVQPKISVITSIALEHTQFLGDSIEKIAAEKAGIIKENTPIICGLMPDEALKVIKAKAKELNAPIYCLKDFLNELPVLECSLTGEYQKKNAATALLVCRVLNEKNLINLDERKIAQALKKVRWDARWQKIILPNKNEIIIDCAHNEEGAKELEKNLQALVNSTGKKPTVITGILGKERARPLLEAISKYAREILFVIPKEDRALNYVELAECLPKLHPNFQNTNLDEVLKTLKNELFAETFVCTGSCYLAGEALASLTSSIKDSLNDKI